MASGELAPFLIVIRAPGTPSLLEIGGPELSGDVHPSKLSTFILRES